MKMCLPKFTMVVFADMAALVTKGIFPPKKITHTHLELSWKDDIVNTDLSATSTGIGNCI